MFGEGQITEHPTTSIVSDCYQILIIVFYYFYTFNYCLHRKDKSKILLMF